MSDNPHSEDLRTATDQAEDNWPDEFVMAEDEEDEEDLDANLDEEEGDDEDDIEEDDDDFDVDEDDDDDDDSGDEPSAIVEDPYEYVA